MKKLVALSMTLALALSLTACGLGKLFQPFHASGQQGLAGKARFHCHKGDHIQILYVRFDTVQPLGRVDHHPCLHPRLVGLLE